MTLDALNILKGHTRGWPFKIHDTKINVYLDDGGQNCVRHGITDDVAEERNHSDLR